MKTPEASPSQLRVFNSPRLFYTGLVATGVAIVLLTLLGAFWFEHQAHVLQRAGQQRSASLIAEGLAHAVESDLITRDFGALEARLLQAASNEQVVSVLLADNLGKVLSQVGKRAAGEPAEVKFTPALIDLPARETDYRPDGQKLILWTRVGSAMPMGWIRIELKATESDSALGTMRNQMLLLQLFSGLALLTVLVLVLRKTHELFQERESGLLETQQALETVAYHDGLTQLPNRHLLMERIRSALATSQRFGKPLALCFIDLDGFKQVNDRYGHDAGDQLLIEVSRRLESGVRKIDTVARLGGDEFVLLLPELDRTDRVAEILERLLQTVTQAFSYESHRLQVGMSIGIALYPDHADNCDSLLEHADQAMYLAKRRGKNRWVFYEG